VEPKATRSEAHSTSSDKSDPRFPSIGSRTSGRQRSIDGTAQRRTARPAASLKVHRHPHRSSPSSGGTMVHTTATYGPDWSNCTKPGADFQGLPTSARHGRSSISRNGGPALQPSVEAAYSMCHACAHFGGPHTRQRSSPPPPDAVTGSAAACKAVPTKDKEEALLSVGRRTPLAALYTIALD
jgi:hypothetical protein